MKQRHLLTYIAVALLLGGCSRQPAPAAASPVTVEAPALKLSVTLTAKQVGLLGVVTTVMLSAPLERTATGQASVLSHEALAQSLAEVRAASAVSAQSDAALTRLQGLAATPGAMSEDLVEVARRQARVDAAQLQLAQRRQHAQFGEMARAVSESVVDALGDGRMKLVRIVFPPDVPEVLNADAIRIVAAEDLSATHRWTVKAVWGAPTENGIPGHSAFGVVEDPQLSEGRRMLAVYSQRTRTNGVLVPATAVFTHEGLFWCYIKMGEGEFERRRVDTDHPAAAGYVVAEGLTAGEQVVTRGAGVLLSHELGASQGEG